MPSLRSAQAYWDNAAETYERDFCGTLIGRLRRDAVWRQIDRAFSPGQRILELNCGTGIDAVHLASKGIHVLACDIAPRMIGLARQRAAAAGSGDRVDFRILPTENIGALAAGGPFDGVFSNFSGLNCVEDLSAVARSMADLLTPGAVVLLCVLGRFVPWEIAWFLAHGDSRRAFQRLRRSVAVDAGAVDVRYRSIHEMSRIFAPEFRLQSWKGIGIAVPPSYMEHWARRFPRVTAALARVDRGLSGVPLIRNMADCVLLRFQRVVG